MQTAKGKIIGPLKIEALVNGGAGLAREQGRVIFVPDTVPGDVVFCRLAREKKRYAEAVLTEVLQPSAQRCAPPCPVAAECGGCQWQQLPYSEQLRWKQQLFQDTLIRKCRVSAERLLPIVPSPRQWGYRSRVQIKCFNSGQGFVCGFFRPKSRNVVAIERCPVIAPELNELLMELRQLIAASTLSQHVPQLDLAIGDDGHRRAVVHYLGTATEQLVALLSPLAEKLDVALLVQSSKKASLLVAGDPELEISVDQPPINLNYAAGGFAQINLPQNRQLVEAVLAAARLTGQERVLDLYCGMGNFSLPLARRSSRVCGVEDYAPSIELARRNAARNQLENVEFHVCSAEAALARFGGSSGFDLLVLDPPRAGAYALAKQLAAEPVKRLIYVSCDPQTLARDLQLLVNAGYRLISSQPFDMFPHTFHVESLTLLEYCG